MENLKQSKTDVAIRGGRSEDRNNRVGTTFDNRFELKNIIGKGGMSDVYEARHVGFDDFMAVKILHDSGRNDESAERRFLEEARALFKLNHPNIVRIFDAGNSIEGDFYIATELLCGETFASWIHATPKKDESYLKTAVEYLIDVCAGMEEAHEQGIVHRDLQPANVFLAEEGAACETVPKILDFGLAKLSSADEEQPFRDRPGTVGYMSPEQRAGDIVDERSDVYAMGVFLYEALTGRLPSNVETPNTVRFLRQGSKAIPVAPSAVNPNVPPALDRACLKATELDPKNRFQSISELAENLVRAWPENKATRPETKKSRSFVQLTAVVVVLMCVTGAFLYLLLRNKAEKTEASLSEAALSAVEAQPENKKLEPSAATAPPTVEAQPENKKLEPSAALPDAVSQPSTTAAAHILKNKQSPDAPRKSADNREQARKLGTSPENALVGRPAKQNEQEKADQSQEPPADLAQSLILKGKKALRSRDYSRAQSLFDKALSINPAAPRAWAGLSKISFQNGQNQKAVAQMTRALSYKDRPDWRISLGNYLLKSGDKKGAVAQWEKVIQERPDVPEATATARKLLLKNTKKEEHR